MKDDLLRMGQKKEPAPESKSSDKHRASGEEKHGGKKMGDLPGNQTPNTPNKKESERKK